MRRHATVSASRPRVLPWGWGGRAGGAVLISVLAHAAAAVTAGAVFGTRVRGAAPEHDTVEISVDAPVPGAALAPGTEPVPAPPVKAARLVRRPTPMARPALAAAPAPAAASPATSESTVAVPAAAVPPARFAMSAATLAAVPARVGAGVAAGPTG
ncbi:MAG TPA: hypothetical protein VMU50_05910, partial [Polyangia bacterium]|nr:hypothetical protein [Polyangia bacterium]